MRKRLVHGAAFLMAAQSGSALVEVCAAIAVLSSVVLMAAAAQSQSLILLRNAIEYRRAAWMVAAAAESLRAGDLTEGIEREWGRHAAAMLRDGRLKVLTVSPGVDVVEVSWRASKRPERGWCTGELACVTVFVAAGRRLGAQTW